MQPNNLGGFRRVASNGSGHFPKGGSVPTRRMTGLQGRLIEKGFCSWPNTCLFVEAVPIVLRELCTRG